MVKTSRKTFLVRSLYLTTSLSLVERGSGLFSRLTAESNPNIPLPAGQTQVSESDPTARALGFHHDSKQTDFTLYMDRKKPSAKNQVCKHCIQFTKLNDGWGKCNIISAGIVSSSGWCSAWTSKI